MLARLTALLLSVFCGSLSAATIPPANTSATAAARSPAPAPSSTVGDSKRGSASARDQQVNLRQSSDAALTTMASNWDELDAATRRTLLKEMQRRMSSARQGRSPARTSARLNGTLQIRTERRFGRRVRQSDGSLVTIETRVVQVHKRPPSPNQVIAGTNANRPRQATPFGLGFERRSAARRLVVVPVDNATIESLQAQANKARGAGAPAQTTSQTAPQAVPQEP